MRKYDSYKDSGIEWIGQIPSHWKNVKIKQLAVGENTLFLDGDWIESKEIVFSEDNIKYITTGNIGEGKYKEQGSGYITEETFEKLNCTEVFYGDLVISRLNPPIGRACIIPNLGKRVVTSVDNVILRPNEEYSKSFLVHFFSNSKYYEFTLIEGRGATMQRISRGILGNIKIVVPENIVEQTAIAHYLDRKTAEIDELIADKKLLLKLYEDEKTAIINQAVTKGINPNVAMKASGIEWLGEIPEHWEVKRLKTIARVQTGRTPKIQNSNIDFFVNGELNWFTPSDFEGNGELIDSNRKLIPEAIEAGEVELFPEYSIYLVSIGATLGKVGFFRYKASANQQINIITFQPTFNPLFGYYFLVGNKDMITLEADYTTLPILNQSKTKGLFFAVPPPGEQKSIINYIETESSRVQAKKAKTEKLIELLIEYRTALISEVVTGKIKVIE